MSPARRLGTTARRRLRLRLRHPLVLTVLVLALCGAGVGLYLNERNSRQQVTVVGNPTAPDWIELDVTAQGWTPRRWNSRCPWWRSRTAASRRSRTHGSSPRPSRSPPSP
ncbi:hypothetical protein GXW82_39120 [Streptacidiphilus sp. 4-A2]|nr:hypothetical protein [Streptacidiphilus sp. 4-A2]